MAIDYDALAKKALKTNGGPSVAEVERSRKMDEFLVKAIENMARPLPTPEVNVAPPKVEVVVQQPEAKKAVAWTFEFERNADGTIKRIHATPKD
jgi:hypothetical protein